MVLQIVYKLENWNNYMTLILIQFYPLASDLKGKINSYCQSIVLKKLQIYI